MAKRILKISGIVVGILIIVVVLSVSFFLGNIVKSSFETVGPRLTQTPMSLEAAIIKPISGHILIKEMIVGNPEGFNTDYAIRLGQLKMKVKMGSILSDRIIIDEILIENPEIVYEVGLGGNNIGRIMKNLEGPQKGENPEKEAVKETDRKETVQADAGESKKVQINKFTLRGAKVKISSPALKGMSAPIPLPTIELTDIGKEKEATVASTVKEIMSAVLGSITKIITGSGQLLGKGVIELKDLGLEGGEAVIKGVGDAAGAIGKGASSAGGAAIKGVGSAGQSIGKGVGDAVKGVGGLLKRE